MAFYALCDVDDDAYGDEHGGSSEVACHFVVVADEGVCEDGCKGDEYEEERSWEGDEAEYFVYVGGGVVA